jgi:hypothetical protein
MVVLISALIGGLLAAASGGGVAWYTQRKTGHRSKAERNEQRRIDHSRAATAMVVQSIPWQRAATRLFEALCCTLPDSDEHHSRLQTLADRYNQAEKDFREAAIVARLTVTDPEVKRAVNALYDIYRSFGDRFLDIQEATNDKRWQIGNEALEAIKEAKKATDELERQTHHRYAPTED